MRNCLITFFIAKNPRILMKKIILPILLTVSTAIAMNNNDPRPVQFAPKEVLYYRLDRYDKSCKTNYASFSEKYKLHDTLGNAIRTRTEVSTLIKSALKKNNPDLPEAQIIEHKRNIMNILRPELVKTAKL